jgi:hypothetical protein
VYRQVFQNVYFFYFELSATREIALIRTFSSGEDSTVEPGDIMQKPCLIFLCALCYVATAI